MGYFWFVGIFEAWVGIIYPATGEWVVDFSQKLQHQLVGLHTDSQ